MYKLVVLCSVLAAAAAKPGAIFAPIAYSHSVIAPVRTTITRQASSVVHPSPLVYSTPFAYAHLIKKRSAVLAPVSTYSYIAPTTYATSPLLTPAFTTSVVRAGPYVHTAPVAYTAAHLIKKRSAPLTTIGTYIAPTTYAAYPTTIAAAPVVHAAPVFASTAPVAYTSHFIKKRSADFAVLAPASVSHQSRVDLHSTPVVTTFASPLTYSAPVAYSHFF